MTTLNLTANGKPQELILAYLQENASDVLAEKINSGTPFEKDGKKLINKKTLDGLMRFAMDEAKKLAEKGASSAFVEDKVVYGWAIHYFEEDAIAGTLYNLDGTEYKPQKPVTKTKPTVPIKVEPPKPKQQQASLWDMLAQTENKTDTEEVTDRANDEEVIDNAVAAVPQEDSPIVEEIPNNLQQALDEKNGIKPKKELPSFFEQYRNMKVDRPDDIVLIRLGDFYEAFERDAETLSGELDLTLTGRKLTDDKRIPMVGFPYHASDTYIAKIRKKHSVMIIDVNGEIVTLGKTIPVIKDDLPNEEDEIEELTETEMREFDGDIQEPTAIDEDTEDVTPPYSTATFEKETMIYLYELLDGKMDMA